ncbi:hypothetical protein [Aliiroseovarius sp.]|uniref:hypothetical protein n=1 Tax=Aliiroseovarius sp. TaxID=1872442 RepID=UPI00261C988F|nr:hypothetical protein [Aliiroseovarius sp.]
MSINHEFTSATDDTDALLIRMQGTAIALDLLAYDQLKDVGTELRHALLTLIDSLREGFMKLEKLRQAEWKAGGRR